MPISRRTLAGAAALLPLAASLRRPAAAATEAPFVANRPVRLLVGYGAGTAADIIARELGQQLGSRVGQPVVVENISGGAGIVALRTLGRAAPDGHTVCLNAGGTMTTNTIINPEGRQAAALATPIGQVTDNPHVMVIHGRLPVRDVREFIAYAKARPGEINFGSPGVGSVTHLSAELFQSIAGIEGVHIPYRGADQLLTDIVAGRTHATFLSGNGLAALMADGGLRALGVTAPTRAPDFQHLPVLETQGLPGYRYKSWYGLHAPAATPAPLVERLSALLRAALADEGMRNRLAAQGTDVASSSPAELVALTESDIRLWSGIIELRRITVQ